MPAKPGAQNPAGGSGNSPDLHGKAMPKPDSGPAWPAPSSSPGIAVPGKQTGSNTSGYGSSH